MLVKIKETVKSEEFKFQAKLLMQSIAVGVVTSLAVSAVGLGVELAAAKIAERRDTQPEA